MKRNANHMVWRVAAALCVIAIITLTLAQESNTSDGRSIKVSVDWNVSVGASKTVLTVQVCPEPPMRRGGPIHQQAHEALRDLNASYARLQAWFPYPRLSIAELDPPANGHTSWNFSLIDPIVLDFYDATQGRPIVLNMDIPGWLFKGTPPTYPDDPNEIDWQYQFGSSISKELRDPTYREVADYYRRVAQWYIRGGFTDEYGHDHRSGHHLKIDYWEVLNEQDGMAHDLSPETYTGLYDVVVSELKEVDPTMKFSALALANPENLLYVEYFLNPKHHKAGVPLDMVSYHHYIVAKTGDTPEKWRSEMFRRADIFLATVRNIEGIRNRLSPSTKTAVNEFGFMWGPEDDKLLMAINTGKSDSSEPTIPDQYWSLAASVFAYTYIGVARAGVDLLGAAELVDYPSQLAGTNLIHWRTGEPNAMYRTVKMLHEQLPPNGSLRATNVEGFAIEAQAFDTHDGRRLLLVNKSDKAHKITLECESKSNCPTSGTARAIDKFTGGAVPQEYRVTADVALMPHSVTVISYP